MSQQLVTWMKIAFSYGVTLDVIDWHGEVIPVNKAVLRGDGEQVSLTHVDGPDLTQAAVYEYPNLDNKVSYVLTSGSLARMHRLVTEHLITLDRQFVEPHVETILAAFPNAKCYVIRDHRLQRVGDCNSPAMLVQYAEMEAHEHGPAKYCGFSSWGGNTITYTEAEAWRYKLYTFE
jgi:hypothetical protein